MESSFSDVTESPFIKVQAFTVNDSDRVNGVVCFELQAVAGLFLVKLQVFTINSSDGLCDRVCNGICL